MAIGRWGKVWVMGGGGGGLTIIIYSLHRLRGFNSSARKNKLQINVSRFFSH